MVAFSLNSKLKMAANFLQFDMQAKPLSQFFWRPDMCACVSVCLPLSWQHWLICHYYAMSWRGISAFHVHSEKTCTTSATRPESDPLTSHLKCHWLTKWHQRPVLWLNLWLKLMVSQARPKEPACCMLMIFIKGPQEKYKKKKKCSKSNGKNGINRQKWQLNMQWLYKLQKVFNKLWLALTQNLTKNKIRKTIF